MAPAATPTGFCAAPNAMVASIDLSPHSAMKMRDATCKNACIGLASRRTSAAFTASSASACSSSILAGPPSLALSPSFSDLIPKKTSMAMPASSPTGNVLFKTSGTLLKKAPMPTLMTVMTDKDVKEPMKDVHLPSLAASNAAMKKVLSPISEKKISEKAARNPLLPTGPFTNIFQKTFPCGVASAAAAISTTARNPPRRASPEVLGFASLSRGWLGCAAGVAPVLDWQGEM
eukprot:CAMPEP_0119107488 /NCGR_PEP_ID=MMETSP1180-20130426/10517_1 /TAXON_ID=3052 ORGANISM="Chlamydomonas cf sp, Strain CCMP681" /NCGR_SAMPLE_ID=MMETSP1180 /ASSEMBLY_ACC=CAM_ASM_000741 /LENGTH=231 /DNA_ID=CAMNT_0007092989 /DNA_START=601 /DNA_END=1296 /DNA_ORIENTATION=-